MRVSQAFLSNIVRQAADKASRNLLEAGRPIRENTSVPAPSDNPVAANRLMALDRFEREFDRYDKSRTSVETDLTSAEATVTTMHDIVGSAHELALAMGNDGIDPQTRRETAAQAQRYLDQVIAFANRGDAAGRYLFTGLAEDQPALTPAGTYLGNDGRRFVEVGPGMEVEATLRGQDVFGPNNEVITALQDLVTALNSGDGTQIRNTIDTLDNGRRILSGARSEIGGRIAMMQDVGELSFSLRTAVKSEIASIDQVDVADIAPKIANAEASLEAVVQTSQQLMAQIGKSWLS